MSPPRGLFRLIAFDLDGTLVDSRRDLADWANDLLRESGCATHSEEAVGRMVGDGAAVLVARAFAAAGCTPPADALARFLAIYNGRLLRFTRVYPGIRDLLARIHDTAVLAVLTNKPLGATATILDQLSLSAFFGERVVGGDGPFPRKPDPAGLAHLMADAGASPNETLLVGDSVVDWRTARAAGAECCLARYGFGFEGFPLAELGPTARLIDAPGELLALL